MRARLPGGPALIPAVPSPSRGNQNGQCRARERQLGEIPLETERNRLHTPVGAGLAIHCSTVSVRTARDALSQMIFDDERASRSQFLLVESRQQRANVSAAADRLQRVACGFVAQAYLHLLPHAFGGSGECFCVGLFRAKFRDRLIQAIIFL